MREHDTNKHCRACLQNLMDDTCVYNLLETPNLLKHYIVCTSLTVEKEDEYPKVICSDCYTKITEFYEFKTMCVGSLHNFKDIVAKSIFDDETPVLETEVQTKLEITVQEPDCARLLLESQNKEDSLCKKSKQTKRKKERQTKLKRNQNVAAAAQSGNVTVEKQLSSKPIECNTTIISDNECNAEFLDESDVDIDLSVVQEAAGETQSNESCCSPTDEKCGIKRTKTAASKQCKSQIFQCDICPTRFFVEHRLVAHKRSHDGLVPYPCPREGCDKSFNRWYCLSEHLKEHEGINRWFTCEVEGCSKVYKHKPTLAMHMRRHHQRGPELKSHVCEICGKVFKASAILNDHRYTHIDKSQLPYACEQPNCLRRFSNKEKLKVHLMRHAGIKNFVCSFCGMRKTTRNELKIHINYHTLERTWPCRFCTHVCNSAGNLKMHIRTVHERAKDYACRYCERTFAKPDTRKYHEMTHTGEKPNECEQCGRRFTQPAALRTHRKIHQKQQKQFTEELSATVDAISIPPVITHDQSLSDILTTEQEVLMAQALPVQVCGSRNDGALEDLFTGS
ncbi:zinc finger protein 26 [Teleopsis dalmanni]|uniref:zinc finger protein 26 n=1 Tax=Teleopsis dalmanni TaxID=139649 RepID=UPI0018CCF8DB|nr:zinc finger protein 26 [Teleopsis dalmanni]